MRIGRANPASLKETGSGHQLTKARSDFGILDRVNYGTAMTFVTPTLPAGTAGREHHRIIAGVGVGKGRDRWSADSPCQAADSLATSGTYQEHPNGDMDCLLAKFDSSGQRIWATYFGGAGNDWPYSCAVDIYGHIYLSGYTSSSSLIATPGSHQEVYGGDGDAFLARFDTTGQLVWATYYGGNCVEFYGNCAVGPNGEVYLSGETCSSNNISTPGSHQPDEGGSFDGFLAKFDSSGIQQWGTYYGGNQQDYFWACFVDATGNVLAAGGSESSNGISTTGSYQPYNAGIDDAILVKFLPSGQLLWGTYYGGSDVDLAREIAIDINNNIYVVGQTSSTNNIASPNAQQDTLGGGEADGFLVKFEDCPIPSPAGSISGQANICPPETAVYTVPLIDYATGYTWNRPNGMYYY